MKIRALIKDNKGAGIVTVLVAIMFLTAFGSVLLMLSYTGFEMRASDRKGKQNLYDASAVIDEVSAGLQELCSESIVSSYDNTLVKYNDYGSNVTLQFQQNYRDYIANAYYDPAGDDNNSPGWRQQTAGMSTSGLLVLFDKVNGTYDVDVLSALVSDRLGADVEVFVSDPPDEGVPNKGVAENLSSAIADEKKPDPIILKGVSVKYTKEGRTTTVTTDITIDYPQIGYSNNTYEANINSACIIKGWLYQGAGQGNCEIYGDSYFGQGADLSGAGSTMHFTGSGTNVLGHYNDATGKPEDGVIKVAGNVNKPDARLIVDENNNLWANDIVVDSRSSVQLLGNTYIADDLELKGYNSRAVLGGSYFGFGNSRVGALDLGGNPVPLNSDKSSAILVNGKNAELDMSALESLSLAGYAFVGTTNTVVTGQSVAVKPDQTAYLIDIDGTLGANYYIYHGTRTDMTSNPVAMSVDEFAAIQNPDTDQYPNDGFYISDAKLWKRELGDYGEKLSDYGISSVKAGIEVFPGGDSMVYCFAEFDTPEHASEYFKDYFRHYPDSVKSYVNEYVSITQSTAANSNAGVHWYKDDTNEVNLGDYLNVSDLQFLNSYADSTQQEYINMITSLNQASADDDPENPVNYILSEDLENLDGNDPYQVYYDGDGNVVAIAANGPVEIKKDASNHQTFYVKNSSGNNRIVPTGSHPEKVCLIVTTGNVTVDGVEFDGLLISHGDLELKQGAVLNKNPDSVKFAYQAKAGDGSSISDYINNAEMEEEKFGNAWTVTDLVGYQNWNRTTEDD